MTETAVEEKKEYTPEDFVKEYTALCEKTGFRVSVKPALIPRDDGSWSTFLQTSVEKMVPQNLTKIQA